MLIAPAAEEEGVQQLREGMGYGLTEPDERLAPFVLFPEDVQKAALLKHGIPAPRGRISTFSSVPYGFSLSAKGEKGSNRVR